MLAFSQVGPNTARLLGFSPSNAEFTGADGALCAFQLVSNEAANSVALGVDNGLMSNVALGDVMSAAYGVSLSQAYPAVQVPAEVALGVVPVAEPQPVSFTVTNQGGALLVLQDLQVQSEDVEVFTTLPLALNPGESAAMELVLTPSTTGEVAIELALTHNAEGGFTPVVLSADVIQPNYLRFENDYAPLGGTWSSAIRLVNTEPLKGMQFDVDLPEGIVTGPQDFGLLLDDPSFQLSVSSLGANVFRVIVFNLTGASVPAGNQAFVSCSGGVDVDLEETTYPLPLSGVVLSNASNQNVATVALEEGVLTVSCAEDLDADGVCDGCVGDVDECGVCAGPGAIFECGCAELPTGACDCDGNELDVLGVCGGACAQDLDQDGICDDVDECVGTLDACGICNGPGEIYECGCVNIPAGDCDCDGNQLDALDICGGDCSEDEDHDGVCDDADDCVGEVDACGVCNGPGEVYDCGCFDIPEGHCDCDGTQPDSFGVCGGACAADLDEDGEVGSSDLLFFLTQFGAACL